MKLDEAAHEIDDVAADPEQPGDDDGHGIDWPELWKTVHGQFALGRESVHGPSHWRRVERIGLRLATLTGADRLVVRLFSVFHDSRRLNERTDPEHGHRGALLARELLPRFHRLDDARLALLSEACRFHSDGLTSADPTIGTCWDADRMDLIRVRQQPKLELLSTEPAKDPEFIRWANGLWLATQKARQPG